MTAKKQLTTLLNAQEATVNDDLAEVLLRRAKEDICGLCNREKMPRGMDATAAELALIYYNRIGAEGEQQRSEGDISYAFELGVPKHIERRLRRFNKGRVI